MPQTVYFPTNDFRIEHKLTKKPMSFMHHHSTYEIFYVISGEREYFIEKEFFLAQEGDFVLLAIIFSPVFCLCKVIYFVEWIIGKIRKKLKPMTREGKLYNLMINNLGCSGVEITYVNVKK